MREWTATGLMQLEWDGTDDQGLLVPPGLYLYELRVQADEGLGTPLGLGGGDVLI